MAQYYADIQGNRGQATRMGTKKSGMDGHIRGWNIGARVFMRWNEATGEDEVTVDLTSGSKGAKHAKRLGTWTAKDLDQPPDSADEINQSRQAEHGRKTCCQICVYCKQVRAPSVEIGSETGERNVGESEKVKRATITIRTSDPKGHSTVTGWLFTCAGLRFVASKKYSNCKWWDVREYSTGCVLGASGTTRREVIENTKAFLQRHGSKCICQTMTKAIDLFGILNKQYLKGQENAKGKGEN